MNIEIDIVEEYFKDKIQKSNMSDIDKKLITKSMHLQRDDINIESEDIQNILSYSIPDSWYRHLKYIRRDMSDGVWYAMWRLLLHWHRSELKDKHKLQFSAYEESGGAIQINMTNRVSVCGEIVEGGILYYSVINCCSSNQEEQEEQEVDLNDRNQIDKFIKSSIFTNDEHT